MQRWLFLCLIAVFVVPAWCPGAAVLHLGDPDPGTNVIPGDTALTPLALTTIGPAADVEDGPIALFDTFADAPRGETHLPNQIESQLDAAAEIPEPATVLLVGVGLVGLGLWRRRKTR